MAHHVDSLLQDLWQLRSDQQYITQHLQSEAAKRRKLFDEAPADDEQMGCQKAERGGPNFTAGQSLLAGLISQALLDTPSLPINIDSLASGLWRSSRSHPNVALLPPSEALVASQVEAFLATLQSQAILTLDKFGTPGGKLVAFVTKLDRKELALRNQAADLGPTLPAVLLDDSSEAIQVLSRDSALLRPTAQINAEITRVLAQPTWQERQFLAQFQTDASGSATYCDQITSDACKAHRLAQERCPQIHFEQVIQSHTDVRLGDCAFLSLCRNPRVCRFIHYHIDPLDLGRMPKPRDSALDGKAEAQWIRCDVTTFDLSKLGKFDVVMADPPWDIHIEVPYPVLPDIEMKRLKIQSLQDNGLLFLWVTHRAMELGRECLRIWGYKVVEEIIWVKTNQLQHLIKTGRTGHWLNHSKEHCLVGLKGAPRLPRVPIDTNVIVAEVRETSRKPDEIYDMIERMAPGGLKIELFGRPNNTRAGWLTLGNQLEGTNIVELRERLPI